MRTLLACVLLAFIPLLAIPLAGCTSGLVAQGPDPQAGHGFRGVVHFSGDLDAQAFADVVPLTAFIKAHGEGTLTIRPLSLPMIQIDGDGVIIVEPVPGQEQTVIDAIVRGELVITRNGVPSNLNAPGSIRSFKAALRGMKTYIVRPPALPVVPPPSKPLTLCCDPNDPTSPCYVPRCP